ncbi:MAG: tetratricopeptide repeat protein [Bacteroidales bacterium]|nr:tetratricopeptide repeat protein [Bacteroidales bacterium]
MPSLIPGYEYDIFISYRQKDNKHDGWVTEFVDNLKGELESTFKEEISVYFDINPHDGLLETHDVDASLKEKLKCLIFIPIISRTYCDPKSFAWEHEFKAFVEQASKDQFGLKVKLPNGNVASRVLPVRIHDLDQEDIKLCESMLGGVMRGVEFVYKEPGVNRSLLPKDHEEKNLNNTNYRNQINKVALAIKEVISGLKTEPVELGKEKILQKETVKEVKKEEREKALEKLVKSSKRRLLMDSIVIAVLVIAAIFAYPKLFKRNTLEKLQSSGERISVAVIPFQNMTNDTIWNVWQDGIQNELITSLTNSEEIKVRQLETINNVLRSKGFTNYTSITLSVASIISRKLDANVFISGSIKQAGTTIRINAQLIDSKKEDVFGSFQIDGTSYDILHIIDSLAVMVKNSLILSKLERELPRDLQNVQYHPQTNSSEAYRCYLYGENARRRRDFPTARNMFTQAIAIDSNFTLATLKLSVACMNQGLYEESREWLLKAYAKRDQVPLRLKILLNENYAFFFETPFEVINYLRQLLEIDEMFPGTYYDIGLSYIEMFQYDKAIPALEKSLEIYNKLDSKPWWVYNYTLLGESYHKTGQYKKEKKLYRKADKDFPDNPLIIYLKAILSLTEGDTTAAKEYLEEYISISKEDASSEEFVTIGPAQFYTEVGNPGKAEEYLRQKYISEPDNAYRIYDLAWFLIDKDRDIEGGLKLIDKALELRPDLQWCLLDCKGWGLYKQGKYEEALKILEKCWDIRVYYQHKIYLHLQEAKKAVASQR